MTLVLNPQSEILGKREERNELSSTRAYIRLDRSSGTPGFRVQRSPCAALVVALLTAFTFAQLAAAGIITVTTTDQEVNSDADCSLQEAIFAANFDRSEAIDPTNLNGPNITTGCAAGSGADTIVLPPGAVFQVSGIVQSQFNVAGQSANPDVRSKITIEGNGARLERVGGLNIRAFVVNKAVGMEATKELLDGTDEPNADGNLTIQDLHIKGFKAQGGAGSDGGGGGLGAGGAIYVRNGRLTVENCTIEGNTATGGSGGAVTTTSGGGGGGGLSESSIGGNDISFGAGNGGGGGGGARGRGGNGPNSGGGGGGTALNGVDGAGSGVGGNGGFNCGGKGGDFPDSAGSAGFCSGGAGGGGAQGTGAGVNGGAGGAGNYGGGGGGGGASSQANGGPGGAGGIGGGGGAGGAGTSNGGSGGFGGGGGARGSAGGTAGSGGSFGGDANGASGGGGAGLGGAIFNDFGTVIIQNSTFTTNSATGGPGAVSGTGSGGAIFSRGDLVLSNVTVSGNSASTSDEAGGITVFASGLIFFGMGNSIVANNTPLDCGVSGFPVTGASGNLIENNAAGALACLGVVETADPQLGPLQLNAPGDTPTMAILSTSPAFNAGDNAVCLATDQRGVDRPQDADCDIGAYELEVTDLWITKNATVNVAIAGEELFYNIVVYNPGPGSASSVEVTDELPEGLTFLGDTAPGGCTLAGSTLTCIVGAVPIGGYVDFQIEVLVPADYVAVNECLSGTNVGESCNSVSDCPGALPSPPNPPQCAMSVDGTRTISNTATISASGVFDPDTSNNSSTELTLVNDEADLVITKFVEPSDTVYAGDLITYTIWVDNLGPSAARNVVINDTLLNSAFVEIQSCAFSVSQGGGAITQFTCTTGPVVGTQFGTGIGTFSTNFLDPVTAYPDPTNQTTAGRIRASFRLLVKGVVDNANDETFNMTVTNTTRVTSDTPDPDDSNNFVTADLRIINDADLRVTKMSKPDETVRAGEPITYTITVDNLGPVDARNVVFTDVTLSDQDFQIVTVLDDPNRVDSCVIVPGFGALTRSSSIKCSLTDPLEAVGSENPPTPNSGRWVVQVVVQSDLPSDINNTVSVFTEFRRVDLPPIEGTLVDVPGTPDSDTSNNLATVHIEVTPLSDLAITKTDSPDPVVAGELLTYTITVTNNGPSTATNVVVKDDLPSQVTVVSVTSPGNICINGVPGNILQPLTCNMGSIAGPTGNPQVFTSEQITVVVRVKSGTPDGTILYNQVRVSSDTEDPNNANDIAVESTLVVTKLTAPTTNFASVSKKGSLLFFSKIELRWNPAGNLTQDTFLTIVNDYPGDVMVQWYFINGDPPLAPVFAGNPGILIERPHAGWNRLDCTTYLTQNESTYLSAATGNPLGCSSFTDLDPGTPPGRPDTDGLTGERVLRGYAIAFAVNFQDHEISWNHLSGSVDIVNYSNRSAWEYNGYAFHCLYSSTAGSPCGDDPGTLHLDGVEYDAAFEKLLFDFSAVGSRALSEGLNSISLDTDLTLYPVDVDLRQDGNGPVSTKAQFDVWNENGDGHSITTRCITCWDQTLLSKYGSPNKFLITNLQTDKGKARIEGVQSSVCDPPGSCCNLLTDLDCYPSVNHPYIDSDCSVKAALLGVSDKILAFSGVTSGRTDAGMTLVGRGTQSAIIKRDVMSPLGLITSDPEVLDVPVQPDVENSAANPRTLPSGQRQGKE